MTKFQIKKRFSLEVLFETEAESLKETVEQANLRGADLSGADLSGAYLRGAYLHGANLSGADLRGAYLSGANLRGANLHDAYLHDADLLGADLRGANLRGAYLRGADLSGAYLRGADLSGANLRGAYLSDADLRDAYLHDANLRGANLRGANLSDANLRGADLRGANLRGAYLRDAKWDETKKDLLEKIALMPHEIPYLYKSIHDGKINGSAYDGECACFCGTLANGARKQYNTIPVKPDSSSPIERFFLGIRQGDSPDNNPLSQLASEWIEEFAKMNDIQLPTRKVIWEELNKPEEELK